MKNIYLYQKGLAIEEGNHKRLLSDLDSRNISMQIFLVSLYKKLYDTYVSYKKSKDEAYLHNIMLVLKDYGLTCSESAKGYKVSNFPKKEKKIRTVVRFTEQEYADIGLVVSSLQRLFNCKQLSFNALIGAYIQSYLLTSESGKQKFIEQSFANYKW